MVSSVTSPASKSTATLLASTSTATDRTPARAPTAPSIAILQWLQETLGTLSTACVSLMMIPPRRRVCRALRACTSVSYTHLRAHETRHDLVCRLLLEKKKKK